eukprot:CAMPEP_0182444954 /NCGR_PEP_ID=MMETSP1172-20130603/3244_1 /TAXON_ID=708627 /ORGANISM="Timspurckia oligopyrenoides, Strain CCMP3278" /LENGTH=4512 /DNA_ID=CAMNT_0024640631 /DNA_START=1 /DNA_END=13539 /DNA_ORIENTATION=-
MASPLDIAIEKSGIEPARVRRLNETDVRATVAEFNAAGLNGDTFGSKYVLYYTCDTFRAQNNEALELSKALANELELPLVVLAHIDLRLYQSGSKRHVCFVLEGVAEFEEALLEQGIGACVRIDPAQEVGGLSVIGDENENVVGFVSKAWAVVTDRPHLRPNVENVARLAAEAGCPVIDVETHLVVPLEEMFQECVRDRVAFEERFLALCPDYAKLLNHQEVNITASEDLMDEVDRYGLVFDFMRESDDDETWGAPDWLSHMDVLDQILEMSHVNTEVGRATGMFGGGENSARKLLSIFIARKLKGYARACELNEENNRAEYGSLLSPYLSFGFLSSAEVASKILNSGRSMPDVTAYIRSLARREMGFNLVNYVPEYDDYRFVVPEERREALVVALESRGISPVVEEMLWAGETPDKQWNAAQKDMIKNGRDLTTDRAFWCQRMIEMDRDPHVAFNRAVAMNMRFMLDALDPVVFHCIAEHFSKCKIDASSRSLDPKASANGSISRGIVEQRQMESNMWNALRTSGVEDSRVRLLNKCGTSPTGKYVLYWAQTAFRTTHNDSLEVAKSLAARADLPLVVVDVMDLTVWGTCSKRHIVFHLEGIVELEEQIELDGGTFVFRVDPYGKQGFTLLGDAATGVKGLASEAWAIVTDRAHMKPKRALTEKVAQSVDIAVIDVEAKLLMPLEVLANPTTLYEPDFNAFNERFQANIKRFAKGLPPQEISLQPLTEVDIDSFGYKQEFMRSAWSAKDWLNNEAQRDAFLRECGIDTNVAVVTSAFTGGESMAKRLLTTFVSRVLFGYGRASEVHGESNRKEYGSLLSPYLCQGFISPAEIAISVLRSGKGQEDTSAYLRNICKREHAFNNIYYDTGYDEYEKAIPESVRQVLSSRKVKYSYTDLEWERGTTHDQRWNTVQHELFFKGREIVQDRRYWAQKLIEYEKDPANAFRLMIWLNDKYMLDAGDACSYANIIAAFHSASHSVQSVSAVEDAETMSSILQEEATGAGLMLAKVRQVNELGPRPTVESGGSAQYVLYVANRTCRVHHNDSLELAKALANRAGLPLIYLYTIDLYFYQQGSKRHVNFLLEGLAEVKNSLSDAGVKLVLRIDPAHFGGSGRGGVSVIGDEEYEITGFSSRAWAIVMDRGHLKYEREVAARIAAYAGCSVVDFENRLVIPVEDISETLENSFETFSEVFFAQYKQFLSLSSPVVLKHQIFSELELDSLGYQWGFMHSWQWTPRDWLDSETQLNKLLLDNGIDPNVAVVSGANRGGESPARRLLQAFISRKLKGYASRASGQIDPGSSEYGSLLSPYISFGMISVCELLQEVLRHGTNVEDITWFVKSVALREFSFNFVNFCENYDVFEEALSPDVQAVLIQLAASRPKYSYTESDWESGNTHDSKWNTIQHELIFRGRDLLNDRVYWCQKIIEYESDPKIAYSLALKLNDKYMVDALDPAGYRTVQHCFEQAAQTSFVQEEAPLDSAAMLAVLEEVLPVSGVEGERICILNEYCHRIPVSAGGTAEYVLYWMSSSFRTEYNPAFEIAAALANYAGLPLLVACVVDMNNFQTRSRRHMIFLLEGLTETEQACNNVGAGFRMVFEPVCEDGIGGLNLLGSSDGAVSGFASKAWAIVTDKPHMRHDRDIVERVSAGAGCAVVEVEGRLLVPLEVSFGESCDVLPETSEFMELFGHMADHFLKRVEHVPLENRLGVDYKADGLGYAYGVDAETRGWSAREWLLDDDKLSELMRENNMDTNVSAVSGTSRGGYRSAKKLLSTFIIRKLKGYGDKMIEKGERSRAEYGSLLSPFLSFGFISPVEILYEVRESGVSEKDLEAFKLSIARRELSYASVFFNRDKYDKYESAVPRNVQEILTLEARSRRKVYAYTDAQWENGETHDANWNTVQHELKFRGRDMTQDRVYWCLKLIEYEQDPANAYRLATYLNDKYMLDADAIGFRNISECFELAAYMREEESAQEDPEATQALVSEALEDAGVSPDFVRVLNKYGPRKVSSTRYVLYWCTTAPRKRNNPALQLAIGLANRAGLPLLVVNVVDLESFKTASRRHFVFLLEGIQEFQSNMNEIGAYTALCVDPPPGVLNAESGASIIGSESAEVKGFSKYAHSIVTDRLHLRYGVELQRKVAEHVSCPVIEVESKLIVPLETMADRFIDDFPEFYNRFLDLYKDYSKTYTLPMLEVQSSSGVALNYADLGWRWEHEAKEAWKARDWLNHEDKISYVLTLSGIDAKVSSVSGTYRGGEGSARRLVNVFLSKKLPGYNIAQEMNGEKSRSEYGSLLSPYLTNGFISASEICFELSRMEDNNSVAFIKNLARREQAFNFVRFTSGYDDFEKAVPEDVRQNLTKALAKRQVYDYTDDQWENGETHDSRWNTVQRELRFRGRDIAQDRYMWCIKLIEYERDFSNAYRLALKLNDKYMVDAMDAISFKNIADCFRSASLTESRSASALEDRSIMEGILEQTLKIVEVHPGRVKLMNSTGPRPTTADGGTAQYVLYWATSTCRRIQNESLEVAKALANQSQLPLVVLSTIDMNVLQIGSKRHVVFLLEGLVELYSNLADMGIRLCVRVDPLGSVGISVNGSEDVKGFASHAWAVVTDEPHLRYGKEACAKLVQSAGCSVIQVESRLVVPIDAAGIEEDGLDFKNWFEKFARLSREYARKLVPLSVDVVAGPELELFHFGYRWPFTMSGEWTAKDWLQEGTLLNSVIEESGIETSVPPVSGVYRGGEGAARKLMNTFIAKKLRGYNEEVGRSGESNRSEYGSLLSPYFCNGFISANEVVLEVFRSGRSEQDMNSFLKNLARRELAFHYVALKPDGYDQYEDAVPQDVRTRLAEIARARPEKYTYSEKQWESGDTHDGKWNSIQQELVFRGRDIAQDRFYWLYKVIEYESDPKEAYRLAMKLNDKYMVDALDAVGYFNVSEGFEKVCELEERRIRETANQKADSAFSDTVMKCLGPTEIEESRVRLINSKGARATKLQGGEGEYVLYFCTLSFRTHHNESLEMAKALANYAGLPLVVLCVLDLEHFRTGSIRHIIFLLEGLAELEQTLAKQNIRMEFRIDPMRSAPATSVVGDASRGITGFASKAWAVVTDRAYLSHGRDVEARIGREANCPVVEVESRLLVPLELSAEIMEDVVDAFFYRFFPLSNQFIKMIPENTMENQCSPTLIGQLSQLGSFVPETGNKAIPASALASSYNVVTRILEANNIPVNVSVASGFSGGEKRGRELLMGFVSARLVGYSNSAEVYGEMNRSEYGSLLSPYLSFGFISVVDVAVEVLHSTASDADIIAFLRNLCRRELAYNFVYFNKDYDTYDGALPAMIRDTLETVASNRVNRYNYTDEEWENGETHDLQWNEVQNELVSTGRELMNDRVFWCEKIISFEAKPSNAFRLAVYLNDKYMIDALDPVGYKNVAECFNLACLTSGEQGKTNDKNPIRTLLKNALDTSGVDKTRVRVLNDLGARAKVRKGKGGVGGEYVLYWANSAFRSESNEALELAKALANMSSLPLVFLAVINLNHFQRGSFRHIKFVLDGLAELEAKLESEGIAFCVRFETVSEVPSAVNLTGDRDRVTGFEGRAWAIITDRAHLRTPREVVKKAAFEIGCALIEVETSLSVPLEKACSGPAPDFDSFYERFLPLCRKYARPVTKQQAKVVADAADLDLKSKGILMPFMNGEGWSAQKWVENHDVLLSFVKENRVDTSVSPVSGISGGETNARTLMETFLTEKLKGYTHASTTPGEALHSNYGSGLSPYLCFGFISLTELMSRVFEIANSEQTEVPAEDISAFLQNLARREMAFNFVHYYDNYDSYEGTLSHIVRKTLEEAGKKRKNYDYTLPQWENGETHDEKWNAVQKHLLVYGRNMAHDRSFWCQKIIEYNRDPSKAFQIAMSLNERLMVDALDAVSYRNVSESFKLASLLAAPQSTAINRPAQSVTKSDKSTMKALVKAALEDCGVERSRVRLLNDLGPRRAVIDNGTSEYVLYWMSSSFRSQHNESFEVAKILANHAGLPLVVLVVLDLNCFVSCSRSHVIHFLEGVLDLERSLQSQGAKVVFRADPSEKASGAIGGLSVVGLDNSSIVGFASRAWAVVTDRSHMRYGRSCAKHIAGFAGCSVIEVESRLMVPLEVVGNFSFATLEEFGERFFSSLSQFSKDLPTQSLSIKAASRKLKLDSLGYQWDFMQGSEPWSASMWMKNQDTLDTVLRESDVSVDHELKVKPSRGGENEARGIVRALVADRLKGFSNASMAQISTLSELLTALSFGFISPLAVVNAVVSLGASPDDLRAMLWKLTRLEFAYNRVYFNPGHLEYGAALPDFVRQNLEMLKLELADPLVSDSMLELGQSPDAEWNRIQLGLRSHGRLLQVSATKWVGGLLRFTYAPAYAYSLAIQLLTKYSMDTFGPLTFSAVMDACERVDREVEVIERNAAPNGYRYSQAAAVEANGAPHAQYTSRVQTAPRLYSEAGNRYNRAAPVGNGYAASRATGNGYTMRYAQPPPVQTYGYSANRTANDRWGSAYRY